MGVSVLDDLWAWVLIGAALLTVIELLLLERRRRAFVAAAQPRSRTPRARAPMARESTPTVGHPDTPAPQRKRRSHHAVHHILDTMTAPPAAEPASRAGGPEPAPAPVAVAQQPQPEPPLTSAAEADAPPTRAPLVPAVHELPAAGEIAATHSADADVGIVYVDLAGRFTFATQVARDLLEWQSGELTLADILAQGGGAHSTALLKLVAQQEVLDQPVQILVNGHSQQFEISALALRDRDGKMWGAALFLRRSASAAG